MIGRVPFLLHKVQDERVQRKREKTKGILHDKHIVDWQVGQPRPQVSGAGPV